MNGRWSPLREVKAGGRVAYVAVLHAVDAVVVVKLGELLDERELPHTRKGGELRHGEHISSSDAQAGTEEDTEGANDKERGTNLRGETMSRPDNLPALPEARQSLYKCC